MAQNENQNVAVLVTSIIVIGLIMVIGIFVFATIQGNINVTGNPVTITNESLTSVTESGKYVSKISQEGFVMTGITSAFNNTGGLLIPSVDYSFTPAGLVYVANGNVTPMINTLTNESCNVSGRVSQATIRGFSNANLTNITYKNYTTALPSAQYTWFSNGTLVNKSTAILNELNCTYTYVYFHNSTYNNTNWKVTYTYTNTTDNSASRASGDMVDALGLGPAWLAIIMVIAFAVIVLGMISEGLGKSANKEATY